jgi:hypothetical protein
MKKIKKKKTSSASNILPAFIVGWTHDDPPPPGFLAAWFDRQYGGPLTIRFLESSGHRLFDAAHTSWSARIDLVPTLDHLKAWQSVLQWSHPHAAFVGMASKVGGDRGNAVLHQARLARGLTMLTGGTTYDVNTGQYLNPSDWQDRDLVTLNLSDHIYVEHQDCPEDGRVWLHTRGLSKFGWDDLEAYRAMGLTDQECRRRLLETAEAIIRENRNLKIGEYLDIPGEGYRATVVRHRTDSVYGRPLAYREITWV